MSSGGHSLRRFLKRIPWIRQARSRWLRSGPQAMHRTFRQIYRRGYWGGTESLSGPGSDLANTEGVRRLVEEMIRHVDARSLLDAPCGDFNWMRRVKLGDIHYTGVDIVPDLIAENRRRFEDSNRRFQVADLVNDELPATDLILCRDCWVHLPFHYALPAVANLKRYGGHLLTTTYPGIPENRDVELGGWRALDLQKPPFDFPAPIRLEPENSDPQWPSKSLGLWRLADL